MHTDGTRYFLIASVRSKVDKADGSLRMYYFGGDGPHYGPRNSSLALSTFRPHGLAGVGAAATWVFPVAGRTTLILVTGPKLVLSADADIPLYENHNTYTDAGYRVPVGSVTMTALVDGSPPACTVVGANITEQAVASCNLSSLVGKRVAFGIEVSGGALLYTIGFSA